MEECIICFDETDQFVFLPCAHKVCIHCIHRLDQKKCPVCNTLFEPIYEVQLVIPEREMTPRRIQNVTMNLCMSVTCLTVFAYFFYEMLNNSEI